MITYGFFNAVNGDRRYSADQLGNYFKGLISNGIFEGVGKGLQVTAGNGMSVNVGTGKAYINEKWLDNDSTVNLSIDTSDSAYDRIDVVVIRLDYTARNISIKVLKGTSGTSPSAPSITRSSKIYDLKIAEIRVKANSASISTANITDCRLNTSVCGFVTGLIKQVNTADLFLQMQSDYKAVRNSIVKDLNVNTQVVTDMKTITVSSSYTNYDIGLKQYQAGDNLIIVNEQNSHIYSADEYTIEQNDDRHFIKFVTQPANGSKIHIILIKSYVGGTGSVPFYTKSMLDAKFSFDSSYLFDKNGKIILSNKSAGLGSGWATNDKDVVTSYICKNVTSVSTPAFTDCPNLKTIYIDNTADNIKMPVLDSSISVIYNDSEKDTFFNYAEFLLQQMNKQNKQFDFVVDDNGKATIKFE